MKSQRLFRVYLLGFKCLLWVQTNFECRLIDIVVKPMSVLSAPFDVYYFHFIAIGIPQTFLIFNIILKYIFKYIIYYYFY